MISSADRPASKPTTRHGSGSTREGGSSAGRALDRDRRVVEQCIEGVSLLTIGQEHGYVSPGPTSRLIDRAVETVLPQLDVRAKRRVDEARLDRLLAAWWQPAVTGDSTAARLVLAILDLRTRLLEQENGTHDSSR